MEALQSVPKPQLVIIQTIDNDIQGCDPKTETASASQFGQTLLQTLRVIAHKSPGTKILTFAQFGSPAEELTAIAKIPEAKAEASGSDPCDGFDESGVEIPAHVTGLTKTIELYDAQEAAACAKVANCVYTGVSKQYIDEPKYLAAGDWNHQSVAGDAAWSALMWPTVAKMLGIRS